VTCLTAERRGIMSSDQIDRLCQDWLREHYSEAIASEYKRYVLVMSFLLSDVSFR
jgi:hypothetical protein